MKLHKEKVTGQTQRFDQAAAAVLSLPPSDRARLADRLLQSLESPDQAQIDEAWALEIERRIRAIDEGKVQLIPGEEVIKQLRSRFKK